jgi:phosphatidylglycerophosphatase C
VGIEASAVLGTHPRVVDERLLPALEAPVLVGTAKLHALRTHTPRPILAAFGDDVRDLELLGSSRLPVAIHPTEELLSRRGEVGDLTVLSTE